MRRSILHFTAIAMAVPGMLGLLFSTLMLVLLIVGFANASQGPPPEGAGEGFGSMVGAAGIATVAGCYLISISMFFASSLLWGMELLIERAERRNHLINEQTSALFDLQRLLSPYE